MATWFTVSVSLGSCTAKIRTYARAHLSQCVEDAIQHDEQGEHRLDRRKSTTNYEAENRPPEKTQSHSLSATNAIHEKSSNDATGEIEAVNNCTETDVLLKSVLRVQSGDDCRTEDSEWIRLVSISVMCCALYPQYYTYHEVVEEPRQGCSKHWFPISLDHKHIWYVLLDRMFLILRRVKLTKTKKQKSYWQDETNTKVDSPDAIADMLMVSCEDDQCHNTCHNKSEVDGEVCSSSDKKSASASNK